MINKVGSIGPPAFVLGTVFSLFLNHFIVRLSGENSSYFQNSPVLLLCLFFILVFGFIVEVGPRSRIRNIDTPFFFWISIVILSALKNSVGFEQLVYSIIYPSIWYLLYMYSSLKYRNSRIRKTFRIFSLVIILCMLTLFWKSGFILTVQQNDVYIAVALLPWILSWEKGLLKRISLLIVVIIAILSLKRGAMVALSLGLITYYIVVSRRFWGTLILLSAMIAAMWLVFSKTQFGEILNIVQRFESISKDNGSGRIEVYQEVISALKDFKFGDWLIGRGYLGVQREIPMKISAHNDLLEIGFDFGLLGLFSYFYFVFYLVSRASLYRLRSINSYAAYVASLVMFVLISSYSHFIIYTGFTYIFIIYWGFCEGIGNKKTGWADAKRKKSRRRYYIIRTLAYD